MQQTQCRDNAALQNADATTSATETPLLAHSKGPLFWYSVLDSTIKAPKVDDAYWGVETRPRHRCINSVLSNENHGAYFVCAKLLYRQGHERRPPRSKHTGSMQKTLEQAGPTAKSKGSRMHSASRLPTTYRNLCRLSRGRRSCFTQPPLRSRARSLHSDVDAVRSAVVMVLSSASARTSQVAISPSEDWTAKSSPSAVSTDRFGRPLTSSNSSSSRTTALPWEGRRDPTHLDRRRHWRQSRGRMILLGLLGPVLRVLAGGALIRRGGRLLLLLRFLRLLGCLLLCRVLGARS